jgi:DNA-directed RNA polymerase subunit RPC12/RpoP
MAIPVICPYCQHNWQFKGNPDKIYITCPGCYKKVQIKSRPEKPTVKAPPAIRKSGVKLGSLPEGSTITGIPTLKQAGRSILQESIEVPTIGKHESPITFMPSQHSLRMIRGSELWKTPTEIHLCEICGHKLFEDLRFNCMVDEKVKVHGSCIAEQAVLESGGDLGQASVTWGIPLEVLQQKAKKLIKIIGEENHV